MHVPSVERILEQLSDIIADRILGAKALRPGQECAACKRSLFDREAEGKAEVQVLAILDMRLVFCQESVDAVR